MFPSFFCSVKQVLYVCGVNVFEMDKEPKCSNCKNCLVVYKHPLNKGEFKGSITDAHGFVCVAGEVFEGKGAMYMDSDNWLCELHEWRQHRQCGYVVV